MCDCSKSRLSICSAPLDNCAAKTPKTPGIGLPVCCKEPIHFMSVLRIGRTYPPYVLPLSALNSCTICICPYVDVDGVVRICDSAMSRLSLCSPLDTCEAKTPKTAAIGMPVCCQEPIYLMSVLRSDTRVDLITPQHHNTDVNAGKMKRLGKWP